MDRTKYDFMNGNQNRDLHPNVQSGIGFHCGGWGLLESDSRHIGSISAVSTLNVHFVAQQNERVRLFNREHTQSRLTLQGFNS